MVMSVSSGLMVSIMTTTPTMVTSGGDELREALLQGGGDVVHVVGDPAHDLPVRAPVVEGQGKPRRAFR